MDHYAADDSGLATSSPPGEKRTSTWLGDAAGKGDKRATHTYVASNGGVYSIEPFMLPPPSDIAEAINEMRGRRERSDSNLSLIESKSSSSSSSSSSNSGGGGNGKGQLDMTSDTPSMRDSSRTSTPNKLSTLTPFSPGTLKENLDWMQPGKPRSILSAALTPIKIDSTITTSMTESTLNPALDVGEDGNYSPKRGSFISRSLNSNYRTRTASAPEFANLADKNSNHAPSNVHFESPDGTSAAATAAAAASVVMEAPMIIASHLNGDIADNQHQQVPSGGQQTTGASTQFPNSRDKLISAFASQQVPPSKGEYFHMRKFSLFKYLKVEMFGVGEAGNGERRGSDNITNFLTVPFKIERMVIFGFFVCMDAFSYTLTYLPVRLFYSLYLLCKEIMTFLLLPLLKRWGIIKYSLVGQNAANAANNRFFHRTHAYDLIVGSLMIIGVSSLQMLNMGRVYHYIRGQNMIKLYVLTGMLEVFDKLLASFGQDAFDSLYWQTRRYDGRETGKIAYSFLIVAFYVMLHSGIYFIHIATLTVAINSAEQALITVLILNNFAEIKSFVFKKFDKQNLFQLACSDITERFQLTLFLTIITCVAFAQSGSFEAGWSEVARSHSYIIMGMLMGESVADWIKHAFISKFNFIDASVYDDFMRVLRKDILNSHKDKVILNHTYAITRRVGLSQIPLGCVAVRYFNLAFSSANIKMAYLAMPGTRRVTLWLVGFGCLLLFKIIIGITLVFYSGFEHNKELDARAAKLLEHAEGGKPPMVKRESLAQLSNIERYTGIMRHHAFHNVSCLNSLILTIPPSVLPPAVYKGRVVG